MCKVDPGYDLAVRILVPLNHDRYKSYFNHFTIINLGLFTAMNADKFDPIKQCLAYLGIVACIIWLIVLIKINIDISNLWKKIGSYENSSNDQVVKLFEKKNKFIPSGWAMIIIPILFGLAHVFVAVNSTISCSIF